MESEWRFIRRFSRTERMLHWVHATAFFVMLGSGLILYVPSLSTAVGRRPFVKDVHFDTGLAWLAALAIIVLLGDRRGLRQTLRELEAFDRDDRAWLRHGHAPQGRFNAGQKLNAALQLSFAVLFTVSGLLLWYGERDHRFRFASTILLHDGLMYVSLVLLVGHLYLALIHPATRHALRGMTYGDVDHVWARRHHRKWVESIDREREEYAAAAAAAADVTRR
jgi:formate dehydrogenase subunit gamma